MLCLVYNQIPPCPRLAGDRSRPRNPNHPPGAAGLRSRGGPGPCSAHGALSCGARGGSETEGTAALVISLYFNNGAKSRPTSPARPPALRLALPRASSHAAPGDAGRVFPGAVRRVRPRSPQPQPAPCQGLWITHEESSQKCPPVRLSRGDRERPSPERGARAARLRSRLNTPGLEGWERTRGVCSCAEERAISQNSFSPFYYFLFSLSILFFRGGCCGVAWHE